MRDPDNPNLRSSIHRTPRLWDERSARRYVQQLTTHRAINLPEASDGLLHYIARSPEHGVKHGTRIRIRKSLHFPNPEETCIV